ncbi:MAG: DUF3175 domain-containing protein [Chitinophagaceae bacterium]
MQKKKPLKKSSARKSSAKKPAVKKSFTKTSSKPKKKWSGKVTKSSNALDLEQNIFESQDPKHIAESLKKSAEKSKRKKGTAYQSAMSMLNFYINRAGKNLPEKQKEVLEKSKDELRKIFGREEDEKEKK